MEIPLELTVRGFDPPPALEARLREKANKLQRFHPKITGCRVAVEKPHQHPEGGNDYRVRIDITVPPGHEIVVREEPGAHQLHDDLTTVVNLAFKAAGRQLKELKRRQEGDVKTHAAQPTGIVVRLFDDHGFIRNVEDGHEVYFHAHSVVHDDFERITVGTEVRYEETRGHRGPQATAVHIVGKPGVSPKTERSPAPYGWED